MTAWELCPSATEVPKRFPGPCAEQVTFPGAGAGGGRSEAPSQEESEHLGLEGSECDGCRKCSSNRSVLWPLSPALMSSTLAVMGNFCVLKSRAQLEGRDVGSLTPANGEQGLQSLALAL